MLPWCTCLALIILIHGCLGQREQLDLKLSSTFLHVNESVAVGAVIDASRLCALYTPPRQQLPANLKIRIQQGDERNFFVLEPLEDDVPTGQACWALKLTKQLDADADGGQQFSLIVRCTDGRQQATRTLNINVLDVNDNAPRFVDTPTVLVVSEDTEPDTPLLTVTTTDPDSGVSGINNFRLQDDFSGVFGVSAGSCSSPRCSAQLSLLRPLNFDDKQTYTLNIIATDGANRSYVQPNSANFELTINVKDVQNSPPRFVNSPQLQYVAEDVAVGERVLQVQAVDGDTGGQPNEIYYDMLNRHEHAFDIDKETGWIFVRSALDREAPEVVAANGVITLQILAREQTSSQPQPVSHLNVSVVVTDVDDSAPQCDRAHYMAQVIENAQQTVPLTIVGGVKQLHVFDADQGEFAEFTVSLLGGSAALFDVTPQQVRTEADLLIQVAKPELLDYELRTKHELQLVLTPTNRQQKKGYCNVTVQVLDANDNTPYFTSDQYLLSVAENRPPKTFIGEIQAADNDSTRYWPIKYSLSGAGHAKFGIDDEGNLFTRETLDREQQGLYELVVTATDNDGLGNRRTSLLRINVEDENDNAPQFTKSVYTAYLLENSVTFTQSPDGLQVEAVDPDDGRNGTVTYAIDARSPWADNFTIDPTSGRIEPIAPGLDRDVMQTDYVNMTVVASDHALPPRVARATVIVVVNDSNDEVPVFARAVYEVSVPENATASQPLLVLGAEDRDAWSDNNQVRYSLDDSADSTFTVEPRTGVITLTQGHELDARNTYSLVIRATDSGLPTRSTTARVNLRVQDINDKPPVFRRIIDEVLVMEHSAIKTPLINVTADDPDGDAVLMYKVLHVKNRNASSTEQNLTGLFGIRAQTGTLYVAGDLDREVASQIVVTVGVIDVNALLNLPQQDTIDVFIRVLDANDNPPRFVQNFYLAEVMEGTAQGAVVTTVRAVDPDEASGAIRYSIMHSNVSQQLVAIGATSGQITVVGRIDYEQLHWINVTVIASDEGQPPQRTHALVSIQVVDANDNRPVFQPSQRYTASVAESAPVGSQILRVLATDADSADAGEVTYALASPADSAAPFAIDRETGAITVARPLDRETRDLYLLTVTARDNAIDPADSNEATAVVELHISDDNDNAPVFVAHTPQTVTLHESAGAGEHVLVMTATDADAGDNARVHYSILDTNATVNGKPLLSLSPSTGVLSLAASVSGASGVYYVAVQARDYGQPAQSAQHTLYLHVLHFTDNTPVMTVPKPGTTLRIVENRFNNQSALVRVQAKVQNDDGAAQLAPPELRYSLVRTRGNQDWQHFVISSLTGELMARQAFDHETQAEYVLVLEACNQQTQPPKCDDTDLIVQIVDENDNCPIFRRTAEFSTPLHISEASQAGSVFGPFLAAYDADSTPEHSAICYQLVALQDDDMFELVSTTSTQLRLLKPLDREVKNSYQLIALVSHCKSSDMCPVDVKQVKSSGYNAASAQQLLIEVIVDDVNDNEPQFTQPIFRGGGVLGLKPGTRVAKVIAVDADGSDTGALVYSVLQPITIALSAGRVSQTANVNPFSINSTSGDVYASVAFEADWAGHFEFIVKVTDTAGHTDHAQVMIAVLDPAQQIELVFDQPANAVWTNAHHINSLLSTLTQYNASIDDVIAEQTPTGQLRAVVLVHFTDDQHNVRDVQPLIRTLDMPVSAEQKAAKRKLLSVYGLRKVAQQTVTAGSGLGIDQPTSMGIYIALSVCIGLLIVVMIVLLCLWCAQNHRYRRKLKAATTFAFGTPDMHVPHFDLPGTNVHSHNSNPVWTSTLAPGNGHLPPDYEYQLQQQAAQLEPKLPDQNSLDENQIISHLDTSSERVVSSSRSSQSTGPTSRQPPPGALYKQLQSPAAVMYGHQHHQHHNRFEQGPLLIDQRTSFIDSDDVLAAIEHMDTHKHSLSRNTFDSLQSTEL